MRTLMIASAALVISACASSGTVVKDSTLAQFHEGVTTEQQVEQALGAPQTSTRLPDGRQQISYIGTAAHAKAATFIPVVGLFAGGAKGSTDVVTFTFSTDGKLASYSTSRSNVDVNSFGKPAEK
jgi:outer membrane protein assembly factor BamE (lipoprotein component of BamABCDE complex)